ncbi:hypothetical protein N7490_006648 [Penicillium lividum]|nr:hypothetical protein N7490_006227 [Penicillium lividum]KAJ5642648.1 hypothetical protein N7490_006648 [Penicillium lividum]
MRRTFTLPIRPYIFTRFFNPIAMAPRKRKAIISESPDIDTKQDVGVTHAHKKERLTDLRSPHHNAKQTEDFGIVLRDFYPPEMANERCQAYNDGTLERPIETLEKACRDTAEHRRSTEAGQAVVHWFKSDMRLHDNRALRMAFELAKENQVPLICLYIQSPEDLTAHIASPARVDFTLRSLQRLQQDLAELDIPLYTESVEKRKDIPSRIVELCQQWEARHLCANIEYEVDELRRDAKIVRLCADNDIDFSPSHDTHPPNDGNLNLKLEGELTSPANFKYISSPMASPLSDRWSSGSKKGFLSGLSAAKHAPPLGLQSLRTPPAPSTENIEGSGVPMGSFHIPNRAVNYQTRPTEQTSYFSPMPAAKHETLEPKSTE